LQNSVSPPVRGSLTSGALNGAQALPQSFPLNAALHAVAPRLTRDDRADWAGILSERLHRAGFATRHRLAAFFGQCAVESCGFEVLEEDLSYSADRLCEVWPVRFPNADAAEACAYRPEELANDVYANRMGNGDSASGDGWSFRGRGLIQITGRTAYEEFARSLGMTLEDAVAHAATRAGAADSAIWFWSSNNLNPLAEAWLLDTLTRRITGGFTGAGERRRLCRAALQALGG
jgi:putative chitinase